MIRIPDLSRRICRLHVSSKLLTALIFFVEYPLEFPFSSAILIRSTGYFYYRSSDLISTPSDVTEEAFNRVGCANRAMHHLWKRIKRE